MSSKSILYTSTHFLDIFRHLDFKFYEQPQLNRSELNYSYRVTELLGNSQLSFGHGGIITVVPPPGHLPHHTSQLNVAKRSLAY